MEENTKGSSDNVILPKHVPFPEYGILPNICNEMIILGFVIFCTMMQYLHIYKTVWWIADIHMNTTVHWSLIDEHIVAFILVVFSRRFIFSVIRKIIEQMSGNHRKKSKLYKLVAKYLFVAINMVVVTVCLIQIWFKHGHTAILCLSYPFVVYCFFFRFKMDPLLQMTNDSGGSYINGMPMHCCSTNSVTIRDEIDFLRNDFNSRLKQVLFSSILNAYFSGCIPCIFAQKNVNYDLIVAIQNIFMFWIGNCALYLVFSLPAKYCDILHRASLHLGKWLTPSSDTAVSSSKYQLWNKNNCYEEGALVKHGDNMYTCKGPVTTAIPGNASHSRFEKIFNNPASVLFIVAAILTAIVIVQILLLLSFNKEWHNDLCSTFLIFTNNLSLFIMIRDFLIAHKVYSDEVAIYKKQ